MNSSWLSHRLRGMQQPRMRLGWFSRWAADTEVSVVAQELESLLACSESFSEQATPALVSLVAWASGAVHPERLHAVATCSRSSVLFRLRRVLSQAHECPLQFQVEGAQPKVKVVERGMTLGERKNRARRTGRGEIAKLLRDPHPAVIEQLLANPQVTEVDVVRLVTLRRLHPLSACFLIRGVRWLLSPRVKLGLLLNPTLPPWQTVPLVSLCTRPELARVAGARNVPHCLQDAARSHLMRHPPLAELIKNSTVH